mmetsp:Transcript_53712/g.166413  ORF Transcript_53712/g.166413 Transcript_53712/m.166413 type:complete len:292 (+) Transcript_53712:85-960(+)
MASSSSTPWARAGSFLGNVAQQVRHGGSELAQVVKGAEILDGLPVASQAKSLLQAASGDREGANRTQHNFTRRCLGVSQLRSALEQMHGDEAAARQTREEFSRTLSSNDEKARVALSNGFAEGRKTLSHVDEAARTALSSAQGAARAAASAGASAGQGIVSRTRQATQRGTDAASVAAQHLGELDLGRRFAELVQRQQPSRREDASCGAGGAAPAPASSLDEYTILGEVAPSQSGSQCPCCLDSLRQGEQVRVLPCFHSIHDACAQKWLYANPVCPVCRCDIRASLEQHRR